MYNMHDGQVSVPAWALRLAPRLRGPGPGVAKTKKRTRLLHRTSTVPHVSSVHKTQSPPPAVLTPGGGKRSRLESIVTMSSHVDKIYTILDPDGRRPNPLT